MRGRQREDSVNARVAIRTFAYFDSDVPIWLSLFLRRVLSLMTGWKQRGEEIGRYSGGMEQREIQIARDMDQKFNCVGGGVPGHLYIAL